MSARYGFRVIDADGHVMEPPGLWAELAAEFGDRAPRVDAGRGRFIVEGITLPGEDRMSPAVRAHIRRLERERFPDALARGWDPESRLKDMDREGVDETVLFPTLGLLCSGATRDRALASALCRAYNDWLAAYCAEAPARLHGVAMVYLHDLAWAQKEIARAVGQLGMKGIFVRPGPHQDRNWHNPLYEPVFAEIERQDVPLCIHEANSSPLPTAGADRVDGYVYKHVVTHPFEQMMASMTLIMGGVLERHPRLRVVFLEAGAGWLPYHLWRMDGHYEVLGAVELRHLRLKPSAYFERQCWISCDPDEWIIPRVIDLIGEDRLVFATDYPHFDSRFPESAEAIATTEFLTDRVKRKILGENCRRLYGL
ncbi:MAG: amidohydrolase [Candidatus Rokubacteria bacterium]|nr:amidohydrolase [Candidatus Rokubacteria bacterium]